MEYRLGFHFTIVCVNGKVDDPSAVVTLLSFLCEKFTVYWGNTLSSFSKLDTYRSF